MYYKRLPKAINYGTCSKTDPWLWNQQKRICHVTICCGFLSEVSWVIHHCAFTRQGQATVSITLVNRYCTSLSNIYLWLTHCSIEVVLSCTRCNIFHRDRQKALQFGFPLSFLCMWPPALPSSDYEKTNLVDWVSLPPLRSSSPHGIYQMTHSDLQLIPFIG